MEKNTIALLQTVQLFDGIEPEAFPSMLSCLGMKELDIPKDVYVLSAGDPVENVGIVLQGTLHVVREDDHGSRSLLATLPPGALFAETLCCVGTKESPVSVLASTDSRVMLLAFSRIIRTCSSACSFHAKLVANMLQVVASKNLMLQARMEFLSKKSIRARLLAYFASAAAEQGRDFSIPMSRETLADFLCVDRSALSRELGRLKDEGIVDFWKNQFRLL